MFNREVPSHLTHNCGHIKGVFGYLSARVFLCWTLVHFIPRREFLSFPFRGQVHLALRCETVSRIPYAGNTDKTEGIFQLYILKQPASAMTRSSTLTERGETCVVTGTRETDERLTSCVVAHTDWLVILKYREKTP